MVGVEWERKKNSDKKANVQDLLMIEIIQFVTFNIYNNKW
jgi:hypothetical protein